MSRAHVQGYDSNPAQFARMGNPWVSERERAEFSAPNRKQARENRRARRNADLGNFPKMPERSSRESSPALANARRTRDFVAVALSRIGGSRTITPVIAKPDGARVEPMRAVELKPLTSEQLELRRQQRDAVEARLAAGAAAYAASEAAKVAERKRLEAIKAGLERRLAKLA